MSLTECTDWPLSKDRHGYGLASRGGHLWLAHRYYASMATGRPLGPKQVVMHLCDRPSCVNPLHLTVGTHKKNMRDMRLKGRARNGYMKKRTDAFLTEG